MSYEIHVYLKDSSLPTRDEWQRALDARNCELELDQFSTRDQTGFLPARLKGVNCGFEYYYDPVDENVPEEISNAIGNRDHFVAARLFSDPNEGRAAELALAVLAEMTAGIFCDPQSGEMVVGSCVFEWLQQNEVSERDRLMAEAERKWASITDRRCPDCGAPCPEYREHCLVCKFRIGRA